ncbi:hypothetical protein RHGRI_035240 [Rhododendron griersonianum]|uniref:Reverse transcriptase domain-containing protein n=1 Tax=Rhododendron griersonianum TaxID=479676 RepID=A0AAV6I9R3_9ERIC|nr:hypothetical protein RHGRI_035240 [Rhododendron griersonianum]
METKNKRDALERIRRRLHFSNSSYVDPVGLWGGLALWWKDDVDIDVRYKTKNMFRCVVTWPSSSNKWLSTFIYAPPNWQHRAEFWASIKRIHDENQFPWLCVGDFNEVGSIWEKQGGNACIRSRIEKFQQFLSDCEFMDLEFKGSAYTWTNNQGGTGNIRERLDRAVATVEWRDLFPYAQVFHEGSKQIILAQKLKKCREALKVWSRKRFGNNLEKIKELKSQLVFVQSKPFSNEIFLQEKAIKEELEITLLREEMYQHQRSRLNWIRYGDKNTSFFHATVTQRRQRNQLSKIRDSRGQWLTEEKEINGHLQDYFSSLFKASGSRDFNRVLRVVDNCITDEMNGLLTRMVSDPEIKEAAFQLGDLKAPGPNGFNGLFYQQFWDTVGLDVSKAVKEFFNDGSLLKDFNSTNLVLIPKVQFPESLSQLRPISLCNFCLKIITKVLANRLKRILKPVISPNQSAFVPGRMIQDSILVAHEAFHFLNRKKEGKESFMAVKLDFNKAYDRVEWAFLEAVMKKMGFADQWVTWVMECVSSVNFTVMANGEAKTNVCPEGGLRQGDPLSPYLFLLVKDVLSKLIQAGIDGEDLAGMRINRNCPTLSHIFFADDAILFLKAELKECCVIKGVLEEYGKASGQLINFEKSGVFFSSNMNDFDKQLCCDFLGVNLLKGDSKYLGLPSFWGRSKAEAYTFLVEKAMGKMQGWKNKLISLGGKETLIKSVVQGIPTYAMACFLLPKKLCDKLNALTRNFWWKGNPEDRGICWASWESLGKAKEDGGMGFRNYRAFNEALLARQGWRLLMNKDAYWARFFKGIYFPKSSFLQASRGSRASWAWLSLLHGRNLLFKGLRWQVQDGKNIDFWNDAWIPSLPNFKISMAKSVNSEINLVADVIDRSGQWDISKMGREIPQKVVDAILKIPLPHVKRPDHLVWHFNSSGIYTVNLVTISLTKRFWRVKEKSPNRLSN